MLANPVVTERVSIDSDGTEGFGLGAGSGIRVLADGRIEALASPVYRYRKTGGKITRLDDLKPGP